MMTNKAGQGGENYSRDQTSFSGIREARKGNKTSRECVERGSTPLEAINFTNLHVEFIYNHHLKRKWL